MLPVKWATTLTINGQTMSGLPRIAGTAGDLKSALNILLGTGYNPVTLDSLSRSGTTATATKSTGLGFITDQVVAVAGANETEWNGEYRIATVTSTTVTFTVPDTHAANPTGTMVLKAPGAGFTITDLGGQLAVYRADDVTGNRLHFWIDDSAATLARVRGWETWSDGAGTGPFPTDTQVSGGLYVAKRNSAGTTGSNYIFVADSQYFYLFIEFNPGSSAGAYSVCHFGDIISWLTADAFGTIIVAPSASEVVAQPNSQNGFWGYTTTTGKYLARDATLNPATATTFLNYGPSESSSYLSSAGYTYPNPLDGGTLIYQPIRISQSSSIPRGVYPGLAVLLHVATAFTVGEIKADFPQFPGHKFIVVRSGSTPAQSAVLIDIIGPWR